MGFCDKLIELRKQRGWSQEDLASRIDVSRQTVSKWELGQTTPEMKKLIELSRIFNITLDELMVCDMTDNVSDGFKMNGMESRRGYHYEYKSKQTLFGNPILHINIGRGSYRAKGVIAIGNIAIGLISMGLFSIGLFSFGVFAIGLIAFASMSAGILAIGGIAVGGIALGGMAIGVVACGGLAVGIYSVGGCAIAKNIAMGGYANAHIAIGDKVNGTYMFHIGTTKAYEVREVIMSEYPHIWRMLITVFTAF